MKECKCFDERIEHIEKKVLELEEQAQGQPQIIINGTINITIIENINK